MLLSIKGEEINVVDQCADLVDFWNTVSEPHMITMLTYCVGVLACGDTNLLQTESANSSKRLFKVVMAAIANARLHAMITVMQTVMSYQRGLNSALPIM